MKERHLIISIDPGVNNGFVVYCKVEKKYIETKVIEVWDVFYWIEVLFPETELILIEDATKNWNPKGGREGGSGREQGAGWIKGLSKTYIRYLEKLGITETINDIYFQRIKSSREWAKKDKDHVFNHTGIITEGGLSHKDQNLRDALMMMRYYGI